jgi:hypothetical protein
MEHSEQDNIEQRRIMDPLERRLKDVCSFSQLLVRLSATQATAQPIDGSQQFGFSSVSTVMAGLGYIATADYLCQPHLSCRVVINDPIRCHTALYHCNFFSNSTVQNNAYALGS